MRLERVLLVRRAVADHGADEDDGRLRARSTRRADRRVDGGEVVAVGDVLHVPAVRLEPGADVLGEAERRRARERDVILVVENDQFPEREVAGERGGF